MVRWRLWKQPQTYSRYVNVRTLNPYEFSIFQTFLLMNTPHPHQVAPTNDEHNLALLHLLYDINPNFSAYAQSINDLFYYYIQHCTDTSTEVLLTSTEINSILEVVNAFQQLKEPSIE
ncbi:Uncharacterised protein [Myroides odoratus]|nr:hypothetical protein HMPREF9716_02903 [Myroides odoratus CIP 103059]STZ31285.1 Uncharacterised protein [Myroides odoratus]